MTQQRALGSSLAVLLSAALSCVASAQLPLPAGGEFRVNTYTTNDQRFPAVAMDGGGNFVVVWTSEVYDGDASAVVGQRYDAAGVPLGGEFQVNVYTTGLQRRPAVAMDSRGNFVVVWESDGQDGSSYGVFGRRFDAAGVSLGAEFQVNTYTTGGQGGARVAVDAGRRFVVVWTSAHDGGLTGVFGQRYDAAGAPVGSEFRVNTYTTGPQSSPAVAMTSEGAFVVVWASEAQDGDLEGIFGQRYDAAGVPVGSEFRVNTYTTADQSIPVVAMAPGGTFVVVWTSDGQDGSGDGIVGRRFDAAGVALGGEFPVNTYTTSFQFYPAVAMDPGGSFVAVWQSYKQDGSDYGVFGQRYDFAGVPLGDEFRVNTYTTGDQGFFPAVALGAGGNFVVVWASTADQDGSSMGVFGQRYGGLLAATLAVDASGNGVLEPGETVTVAPGWRNVNGGPLTFTGAASQLSGPPGATYTLLDAAASYGTVANGVTGSCGTDCFQVSVSRPATRPALHWDLSVRETIGPPALGQSKVWTLHVGESFPDVPPGHLFYRFVETLLHVGVTAGCTASTYCPDGVTTREQMAVFLLRAREGAGFTPPPCTTAPFPDVPCASSFAAWVQELVARGITAGCGGGLYCPTSPVTREQMAVFLLKTREGAGFTPPPCTTASFTDVPCASPFAPWVQELVARAITAGCGGGLYCPTDPVTRGQMAVFLTKTFALTLYGP
jgi:hypothetical protein